MTENNKSFPKIAESNWWKLRELFKKTVPVEVTETYIASGLSMKEDSAQANIITPFKKIGILDENGKPTQLVYEWRDDFKYPNVCQTLFKNIYPQEVRDLFSSLDDDVTALTNWFMNFCRCGEPAAKMYSAFYRLLIKADPSAASDSAMPKAKTSAATSTKQPKVSTRKSRVVAAPPEEPKPDEEDTTLTKKEKPLPSHLPQLHINIQLHISPESTAEQIDKIFESMARHLKDFRI